MRDIFNRLMRRTKGTADMLALPAPSPAAQSGQVQSALKLLSVANHGDRCQTLSFQTTLGAIEWRTGQQDPLTNEWVIRKHSKEPNISGSAASVGETTIKTTTLHEKLTFFQAVAILSEYERGQMALTVLPVNEVSDLGETHVVAFAEREGIVFDTNGAPHPTLNGEIVTDGTFTESALERARAFSRTGAAFYKTNENSVLTQLLKTATRSDDIFQDVLDKSALHSALQGMYRTVGSISILLRSTLERHPLQNSSTDHVLDADRMTFFQRFQSDVYYEAYDMSPSEDEAAAQSIYNTLEETGTSTPRDALAHLLASAHNHAQILDKALSKDFFSKAAGAIDLYCTLSIARHKTSLDQSATPKYIDGLQTLSHDIESFEKRFMDLHGNADELWRVKSTILDPAAPTADAVMHPLLTKLHNMMLKTQRDIEITKAIAHAGPHLR